MQKSVVPDGNLLTLVPPDLYSCGMISDFQTLSQKIEQLAALTQALRSENAELRLRSSALTEENAQLSRRMQEAHDRVAALIDSMPGTEEQKEQAA
ncbi:DUF904 domain-containing protein [Oxalicibacterium faecigallinarum]|uniref:Cell division protein ZapB n=1 Tax=Oxalicibacterium faecigallinarum TaxID=573741 RepID=A0A8J3ASE4_9BURK|nr:DUF904 domain-containing protein [Oxalicibacterium faecigallinarum]GGI20508.1 hypothetical protein GCM10008066_24380 [Oxalicibacterium faecigallinarum]